MTHTEIDTQLASLNDHQKMMVLLTYGHELTISARDGYEIKGDSLTKSKLLRCTNEIMHHIFLAASEVEERQIDSFSLSSICYWISCEDRNQELQKESISCFNRALKKCVQINT